VSKCTCSMLSLGNQQVQVFWSPPHMYIHTYIHTYVHMYIHTLMKLTTFCTSCPDRNSTDVHINKRSPSPDLGQKNFSQIFEKFSLFIISVSLHSEKSNWFCITVFYEMEKRRYTHVTNQLFFSETVWPVGAIYFTNLCETWRGCGRLRLLCV
jgi:hypothetical protein